MDVVVMACILCQCRDLFIDTLPNAAVLCAVLCWPCCVGGGGGGLCDSEKPGCLFVCYLFVCIFCMSVCKCVCISDSYSVNVSCLYLFRIPQTSVHLFFFHHLSVSGVFPLRLIIHYILLCLCLLWYFIDFSPCISI